MANQSTNSLVPNTGRSETEKELFSETKAAFIEDMECLYVRGNQGGRLMFAEKWPQIAERIFDKELVRYDYEGVQNDEDREKRLALEEKAEVKRDEILGYFQGMEKKLVVYGSLQVKELEKIMSKLDRVLAEIIFAEKFVDKYFPLSSPPPPPPLESASGPMSVTDQGASSPSMEASGEAAGAQNPAPEESRTHKENIVVPDTEISSIGHVDHSYNAPRPSYDAVKDNDGNEDDAASWLDMPEDELDGVMPISTDAPQLTEQSGISGSSAPSSMGLKAHQGMHNVSEAEPSPAPEMTEPQEAETVSDAVPTEPAPPASAAPPLPGTDSQILSRPPLPPSSGSSGVPSGMGLRAHQQSHAPSPAEEPSHSETPAPRVPSLPGAENAETPGQSAPPVPPPPQENAPRKPSLDNIDSHLGSSGEKRPGPPPLPGQEDDKSGF